MYLHLYQQQHESEHSNKSWASVYVLLYDGPSSLLLLLPLK